MNDKVTGQPGNDLHHEKNPERNFDKEEAGHKAGGRRHFLATAAVAAVGIITARTLRASERFAYHQHPSNRTPEHRYLIGVCDWMMLKRQKLGAFPLAKAIGVNGVEVDMGGLGNRKTFDDKLVDPAVRQAFLDKAASVNLQICSVAMSAFYAQSFSERDGVVEMVKGSVDIMKAMGVKVAFLPLGIRDDLVKYPEKRPAVIRRLKTVGAYAATTGVVIGIETSLDAAGEVKLLEEIASPGVQSYFNIENPLQAGRDLSEELKILGRQRICQIHCTDKDGVWLQNDPLVNMKKMKKALDDMGWKGWLVMERSRDAKDPRNVKWNYGANAAYLKKIFQSNEA
ncbi:MAG TPA: TIM barrel protein [Chitinophagaceae bacterium]|nr:TIM barrel protein [Chitinophagaceae bacterium]